MAAKAPIVNKIKAGEPLANQNASTQPMVRCSECSDLCVVDDGNGFEFRKRQYGAAEDDIKRRGAL